MRLYSNDRCKKMPPPRILIFVNWSKMILENQWIPKNF